MGNISKFNMDDTITGISALVGGPISIVRISGPDSLAILGKVFVTKNTGLKSHRIYYGWISDGGEKIDEVLVSVMLAPKSFTREDVVEINCHGGSVVVQKILMLLIEHGARLAEPGEFTRRAFLNGRIDLSRAEAVMDVINARSELSHRTAVEQLQGRLAGLLDESCDGLLALLARIEMAIDYPEHEEADIWAQDIKIQLEEITKDLDGLLVTAEQGRIIRDGIKTAIIGQPNVGKSSLLNALAQEDRAIVTHIPGTTRDVLRETIKIGDIFLEIADTAGLRDTEDIVESQGVERSIKEGRQADLVLLVLDGSVAISRDEITALGHGDWRNTLVVINKSDLPLAIDKAVLTEIFGDCIVEISAKNHVGIDLLGKKIKEMFFAGQMEYGRGIVTNTRHIALIAAAKEALTNAVEAIDSGMFIDFIAIDIQAAYAYLGEITGIVVEDELIDRIFSEFCLGK